MSITVFYCLCFKCVGMSNWFIVIIVVFVYSYTHIIILFTVFKNIVAVFKNIITVFNVISFIIILSIIMNIWYTLCTISTFN